MWQRLVQGTLPTPMTEAEEVEQEELVTRGGRVCVVACVSVCARPTHRHAHTYTPRSHPAQL